MMTCAAPALLQNISARASCLFRYSNTNTHANMIEIAGQYVLFFMCVSSMIISLNCKCCGSIVNDDIANLLQL